MVVSFKSEKRTNMDKVITTVRKISCGRKINDYTYFKMIQNIWQADYNMKTFPKNTMLKFVSTY